MKGLEVKKFPGDDLYVSKCGRIFDLQGNELEYWKNNHGYIKVHKQQRPDFYGHSVHRLVLMTWDPIPDSDVMFGNHFDFDITNNHLDNLDWVTAKWNNIHSAIYSGRLNRPVVRCSKGDERIALKDAKKLPEIISASAKEIWLAIKNQTEINGWKVEPITYNDKEVIDKIMYTVEREKGDEHPRKIKVLDTDNMTWKEYPSMRAMANEFGVFITHIRHRLSTKENPRIFAQRYIIHDLKTETDYITKELIDEMRTRGSKPTLALRLDIMEFLKLENSRILTKKYGLSKSKVSRWLKQERIRELNGWLFTYINDDIAGAQERLLEAARPYVK